jgi:autotransporter-associated beta strand protein
MKNDLVKSQNAWMMVFRSKLRAWLAVAVLMFIGLAMVRTAEAMSELYWTGAGDDNDWETADNWVDDSYDPLAPVAGDALHFAGTERLTPNNSFPAGTSFESIYFDADADSFTVGGSQVTLTAGVANNSSNPQILTLPIIMASNSTPSFVADSGELTISGVISGTSVLRLVASEQLTLSGANTHSSLTDLVVGILKLGNAEALGTTAAGTTINGFAAMDLNGQTIGNEALLLNGTGVGSGGAMFNSSSTAATYNGLITLGSAGSIVANNNITIANTNTITGSGYKLTLGGTSTGSSLASIIGTGAGTLTKSDAGTWALSGASTFTGATTISGGKLRISNALALGTTAGKTTVTAGGALELDGNGLTVSEPLTLTGGELCNLNNINTYSGAITLGTGSSGIDVEAGTLIITSVIGGTSRSLTKLGPGKVILSGASTYSGAMTISAGTLQLGNDGTSGSLNSTCAITNNSKLAFNRSDTLTQGTHFNSVISGTGAVEQNGSGTVVLSGANAYEGATTINAGTLLVNNSSGSGTGSGAATVNDTATLGGNGTISGAVTVKSGGRVEPGATAASVGTLTVGGDVTFESGSAYEVEIGADTSCDKLDLKGTGTLTLGSGVSVLDIGTLTGDGRTIAINIKRDGITGEFKDTAGNLLENNSALHLAPNTAYYIHYVNKTDTDDGYIVLNTSPTSAEGLIRAYATPSGVIVEFQTTEEAGQNDIVLYLYRDGRWVEVGRQPAAGAGGHTYRFVVAGLNAGDIVNLLVRDDEGKTHTVSDLGVSSFAGVATRIAQADASGLTLQWESIPGRTYDIYRTVKLDGVWEYVRTVEAVQTQSEAVVTIEPSRSAAFFRIGER